jgi:hypothetical protein
MPQALDTLRLWNRVKNASENGGGSVHGVTTIPCDRTIELAQAHGAELGTYGISTADIESLVAELAAYRKQREEQQLKIAESKAAREMLYASFDEATDILREEIDPLIELVETIDPEFYNRYKAARVIKDIGGHTAKSSKPETPQQDSHEVADTPVQANV